MNKSILLSLTLALGIAHTAGALTQDEAQKRLASIQQKLTALPKQSLHLGTTAIDTAALKLQAEEALVRILYHKELKLQGFMPTPQEGQQANDLFYGNKTTKPNYRKLIALSNAIAKRSAQQVKAGNASAVVGPQAQRESRFSRVLHFLHLKSKKPATTEAKPATTEAKPATTEAKPKAYDYDYDLYDYDLKADVSSLDLDFLPSVTSVVTAPFRAVEYAANLPTTIADATLGKLAAKVQSADRLKAKDGNSNFNRFFKWCARNGLVGVNVAAKIAISYGLPVFTSVKIACFATRLAVKIAQNNPKKAIALLPVIVTFLALVAPHMDFAAITPDFVINAAEKVSMVAGKVGITATYHMLKGFFATQLSLAKQAADYVPGSSHVAAAFNKALDSVVAGYHSVDATTAPYVKAGLSYAHIPVIEPGFWAKRAAEFRAFFHSLFYLSV